MVLPYGELVGGSECIFVTFTKRLLLSKVFLEKIKKKFVDAEFRNLNFFEKVQWSPGGWIFLKNSCFVFCIVWDLTKCYVFWVRMVVLYETALPDRSTKVPFQIYVTHTTSTSDVITTWVTEVMDRTTQKHSFSGQTHPIAVGTTVVCKKKIQIQTTLHTKEYDIFLSPLKSQKSHNENIIFFKNARLNSKINKNS